MPGTRDTAAQRLREWLRGLEAFDLPDWDELPQLDLYMDQVILLLKRYLAPLGRSGEEKAITASIINNYVRMKVMPPPVKKRYSRAHLAYLIIICVLKQSLSISCIQRMLPANQGEEAARALYADFVRQYRSSARFLCSLPAVGGGRSPSAPGGGERPSGDLRHSLHAVKVPDGIPPPGGIPGGASGGRRGRRGRGLTAARKCAVAQAAKKPPQELAARKSAERLF